MAWTSIPAAVYAIGKPITSISYGYLKENIEVHDHISGRGAVLSVGVDELKDATGSISTAATRSALVLPGGARGFYPQIKMSDTTSNDYIAGSITPDIAGGAQTAQNGWTAYITSFQMGREAGVGTTIFAQQTYMQASPPHRVGNVKVWGHFLYVLINANGDIISAYEAPDPPYAHNGPAYNKKDSIERIQIVPHPFLDYLHKDPLSDGLEIVLFDIRNMNQKKWLSDNEKQGKSIIEDMGHINKKGKEVLISSLGMPIIQGFSNRVKIKKGN